MPAILRLYLLARRMETRRRGDDLFFGRTARDPFTPTFIRDRANSAWARTRDKPGPYAVRPWLPKLRVVGSSPIARFP